MGYEAWIKIEHTTPDKQELHRMSEMLNIDVDAIFGKVMRFWIWADQNTDNGHVSVTTLSQVDRVTFCPGFGAAMVKVGWLAFEGGELVIPNFDRHNSKSAKKRANDLRRQRSSRSRHTSVTNLSQDEAGKERTPSLSSSMSLSSSESEGGVGETAKTEDFIGPMRSDTPAFPDPLEDFEPDVAEKARHFWSLFCAQYHGKRAILRNLHLESTHKELRHFAKAIDLGKGRAIRILTEYYNSPPKEDKGLNAYSIVSKLGLVATAPAPWEATKQKNDEDAKARLRRAIRGESA